ASARRTLRRFRARFDRYKLVRREEVRRELLGDPRVLEAIAAHAAERGLPEAAARRTAEGYIEEIVPAFNVLSYYKLGYNAARVLVHLLYRPSLAARQVDALRAVPRSDGVVYLINHRSNADYVVLAYVLANTASLSYAVGEWARTWPLEYVFKSFGSFFIRRGFREPLYHAVLERYVQLITRHRVTQAFFPEGGLTRDGALRPPKLGLLDYTLRTLAEPGFAADLWLVPVGINYDRVLEDRTLIRERLAGVQPPGRLAQVRTVVGYLGWNALRFATGRLRRYGRVAVGFGEPLSARAWLAAQDADVLALPKPERLGRLQGLAEEMMRRIGAAIPVTPVPLGAAALLSFGGSAVGREEALERMDELRDALRAAGATIVPAGATVLELWDRAWRTFRMRRLVVEDGGTLVLLPAQRPLLEYYANSIRHLLPGTRHRELTPAAGPDPSLPHLTPPPPPP
ncbi:MAG TPA: 1-acyl-sn-glycerol-3-phosphate acyltransferase, partial [Gemmatimonadales bacterium]|nr:1-acyl-sn-glycerol-3-phosphate acyltransferase [Gemmatimonadales bacterium]